MERIGTVVLWRVRLPEPPRMRAGGLGGGGFKSWNSYDFFRISRFFIIVTRLFTRILKGNFGLESSTTS